MFERPILLRHRLQDHRIDPAIDRSSRLFGSPSDEIDCRTEGSYTYQDLRGCKSEMDVLSDVLRAVRLTGAIFFDVEARVPWVAHTHPPSKISPTR